MAITSEVPGLEATVNSGGRPLPEYYDPQAGQYLANYAAQYSGEKISRYVEWAAGQNITLACTVRDPFTCSANYLCFCLEVDNKEIAHKTFDLSRRRRVRDRSTREMKTTPLVGEIKYVATDSSVRQVVEDRALQLTAIRTSKLVIEDSKY